VIVGKREHCKMIIDKTISKKYTSFSKVLAIWITIGNIMPYYQDKIQSAVNIYGEIANQFPYSDATNSAWYYMHSVMRVRFPCDRQCEMKNEWSPSDFYKFHR